MQIDRYGHSDIQAALHPNDPSALHNQVVTRLAEQLISQYTWRSIVLPCEKRPDWRRLGRRLFENPLRHPFDVYSYRRRRRLYHFRIQLEQSQNLNKFAVAVAL